MRLDVFIAVSLLLMASFTLYTVIFGNNLFIG